MVQGARRANLFRRYSPFALLVLFAALVAFAYLHWRPAPVVTGALDDGRARVPIERVVVGSVMLVAVADDLDPLSTAAAPQSIDLVTEVVTVGSSEMTEVRYARAKSDDADRLWQWVSSITPPAGTSFILGPSHEPSLGWRTYLLSGRRVVLEFIEVWAERDRYSDAPSWAVLARLRDPRTLAHFTRAHIKRRIAFVHQGRVLSAPVVQGEISGGRLMLGSRRTEQDAQALMKSLMEVR